MLGEISRTDSHQNNVKMYIKIYLIKVRSTILLGGKVGRRVGLITLPSSCANCLEIPGGSSSCSPQGLSKALDGIYVIGSKSFRPDLQKPRQMENAVRDI